MALVLEEIPPVVRELVLELSLVPLSYHVKRSLFSSPSSVFPEPQFSQGLHTYPLLTMPSLYCSVMPIL